MLRKLKSTEVKRPIQACPNDKPLTVHLIISFQTAGGMKGKVVLGGGMGSEFFLASRKLPRFSLQ